MHNINQEVEGQSDNAKASPLINEKIVSEGCSLHRQLYNNFDKYNWKKQQNLKDHLKSRKFCFVKGMSHL